MEGLLACVVYGHSIELGVANHAGHGETQCGRRPK